MDELIRYFEEEVSEDAIFDEFAFTKKIKHKHTRLSIVQLIISVVFILFLTYFLSEIKKDDTIIDYIIFAVIICILYYWRLSCFLEKMFKQSDELYEKYLIYNKLELPPISQIKNKSEINLAKNHIQQRQKKMVKEFISKYDNINILHDFLNKYYSHLIIEKPSSGFLRILFISGTILSLINFNDILLAELWKDITQKKSSDIVTLALLVTMCVMAFNLIKKIDLTGKSKKIETISQLISITREIILDQNITNKIQKNKIYCKKNKKLCCNKKNYKIIERRKKNGEKDKLIY